MKISIRSEIKDLLMGAIDLHVHTSPDVFPRKLDDMEAALQAKENGLQGALLKNHFFPTVDRALLISKKSDFNLMGSITLNRTVGGFNPYAVETAIKGGAKVVWMPTIHSVNNVERPDTVAMFQDIMNPGEKGLSLIVGDRLLSEVYDILEIIRETNVALATGHVSPNEVMALVNKAVKMRLEKIILTHPFSSLVGMTVSQVKELTGLSENVYVEFTCFDCCQHIKNPLRVEQVTKLISEIGTQQVLLTSDGGQAYNPYPVEMLADMIEKLRINFSSKDIRAMLVRNPSYLVSGHAHLPLTSGSQFNKLHLLEPNTWRFL